MRYLLGLAGFRLRATCWYIFVRPIELVQMALDDMEKARDEYTHEGNKS